MNKGRLMGIDQGLKRIGVAVSDPTWLVAKELTIITRTSKQADFARLQQIITEQKVAALIVGIPTKHLPDEVYTQADSIRRWVDHLATAIPLPITLWDEHLTSADARELSIRQRRGPRDPIDDLAARLMLQSFLDALRDGLAPHPLHPAPHNQPLE
ncbi:MAG TPA: Holliday junction resolvase RuvX [Aggregatilineales bacterium]|nr:Holliday junction resolvase RuvX [Aggregatilineales bacterium]